MNHFFFRGISASLSLVLLTSLLGFSQNGNYTRNSESGGSPGVDNTIVGFQASPSINNQSMSSVMVGRMAGFNLFQSSNDVIIGRSAFANSYQSTLSNVAIGYVAGANSYNPAGVLFANVAIGAWAGANMRGNYNTFVGYEAGKTGGLQLSSENRNSFIGAESGRNNVGQRNTFIGSGSGSETEMAFESVYVGSNAGRFSNKIGFRTEKNVYIGNESGYYSFGINNVSIGYQAGYGVQDASSGQDNVFVGHSAGFNNTTGSRNTYLGYLSSNTGAYGQQLQNATAVGANALVGISNGLVLGDTSKVSVGIGTAYPNQRLTIRGNMNFLTASNLRFDNAPFLDINPDRLALGGEKGEFPVEIMSSLRYKIASENQWADYVFAPAFRKLPLKEVAAFIQQNGHLPGIPSAKEVVLSGVDAAQMDAKLLAQIEQLTLHAIEQKSENDQLKAENKALKEQFSELLRRVEKLERK